MIGITGITARGKNKDGKAVVEYLVATEGIIRYYNGEMQEVSASYWGGKLAHEMRLANLEVDGKHMLSLCDGFHPLTGEPLCQNAGEKPVLVPKISKSGKPLLDDEGKPIMLEKGGHRVGYELTFSAPKSLSTVYVLGDQEEREKILEVQRLAVEKAFDFIESKVETRRGHGGKNVIRTEGLIGSFHQHLSSRNLDPQVHTHALIYAVAKGADGKWGTYDSHEIFAHRKAADEIYKNELAAGLKALGYAVEQHVEVNALGEKTGVRTWEIPGTEKLSNLWSSRREDILKHQEEHGGTMQQASLATRKHKDEPTFAELVEAWKQDAIELKAQHPELLTSTAEIKQQKASQEFIPATDEEVLELLHQNNAIFDEKELRFRLGQANSGMINSTELDQLVQDFIQRNELVRVCPERIHQDDMGSTLARRHTEERFAAPWMVSMEQEILHKVMSREGETAQHVSSSKLSDAIKDFEAQKGFKISQEQREAVEHLTTGTGGVGVLSGLAGTGKTTVALLYSAAFKAEGRTVLGACVSNSAAEKLQEETGLHCQSIAKMLSDLKRGKIKLTAEHVVVLDEAGMIDSKQTRDMLAYCSQAGSKLILQGDQEQIQPVGAGSGMGIVKDAIGDAKLSEIRRQKNVQDRHTAGLFYNYGDDGKVVDADKVQSRAQILDKSRTIFHALDANNQIDEWATEEQAKKALIHDYFKSAAPTHERLVLAHSNEDVQELNNRIRDVLKTMGHVDKEDFTFRSISKNKVFRDLTLSRGDQISFNVGDKDLDVINGTKGTIKGIKKSSAGGVNLAVEIERNGEKKTIRFDSHQYSAFDLDYCSTIHKAQGQGKTDIFHLGHAGMMDNQSALVAFTRLTSGSYKLYADTMALDQIKNRLGQQRLKENSIEIKPKSRTQSLEEVLGQACQMIGKSLEAHPSFAQKIAVRREAQRKQNSAALGR
ncbi:MobF family relaxase [Xanthomonas cannabis]|uniref:MobF family relaxase n=1 Tax=Xanthomonas cannabis TaxID=1885674 RepID=UPI00068EC938|nr:MobF family relaxase [Xanthomonas cannabis]